MSRTARCLLAATLLPLAACSSPRSTSSTSTATSNTAATPASTATTAASIPACADASGAAVAPEIRESAKAFQSSIESGPLFAISLARTGVKSCRVEIDESTVSLEYQFADGSSLRAQRDPAIESTNQETRLSTALPEDPVAILIRAEQAAFGKPGCGLNWKSTESRPSDTAPGVETVYRGAACNCQAWIRKDTAGRVIGLGLRSAC